MAIEKMIMFNIIGHITDMGNIARAIVMAGCTQPVNALNEFDNAAFEVQVREENLDAAINAYHVKPYCCSEDYSDSVKKMNKIKEYIGNEKMRSLRHEELIFDGAELRDNIDDLYGLIDNINGEIHTKGQEIEQLENELSHLKILKSFSLPIEEISALKHLSFRLIKIGTDEMRKLKDNYENIPSIILTVSKAKDFDILATFTPNILRDEADKIFLSLNCEEVSFNYSLEGIPEQTMNKLQKRIELLKVEIEALQCSLNRISAEKAEEICILHKSLELELKSSEIRKSMACSAEFFYFSAWVPKGSVCVLTKHLEPFEHRLILSKKEVRDIGKNVVPPTCMKNNKIVRPFESMVTMYGVPSYEEIDPTTFMGMSYMLLFGAMFGDVGQGSVFLLTGLLLTLRKKYINFGEILLRVGVSSTVFGFLYGSFFGNEELIEAVLISPMTDIMTILVYGVVFGCILLCISFIFSLINNFRRRDLENGLFGKEGLTGFVFFLSLLLFSYTKYSNLDLMPDIYWYAVFTVSVVLMLFKQPLANTILGIKPVYREEKLDYYVEGSFGIVETLISLFSNTLSFIRVGAFALNHVGLFMAFRALGEMMQGVGSVLTYVAGNIVIIGLEGLIVFIQGLRLEYYELFSKYFQGGGIQFEPVKVNGIELKP